MPGLYGLQRRAQDLANFINQGRISAALGGSGAVSASGGPITAQLGTASLSSGAQLTLDLSGDGLIHFAEDAAVVRQALGPNGQPLASQVGEVTLTAKAVSDLLSNVVNNRGIMVARSLVTHMGVARLIGGDEKPGVMTATGPVEPPGQIRTSTPDQAAGLVEASTAGSSAASAVRVWPETGWSDSKAASSL